MARRVLITGASRGIGRATALDLALNGWEVWAVARSGPDLEGLRRECLAQNPNAILDIESLDLTAADGRARLRERLSGAGVTLDAVVLNAGVGLFKPAVEMTERDYDYLMDVNLRATFFLAQDLLPFLRNSPCPRLVGITSDVSRRTFAGGSLYCMSKYAQDALFHTLRKEWREHRVRVSVILPGLTDTNFGDSQAGAPHKAEWLKPEDLARTVRFVLEAPDHVVLDEVMLHPFCQDWQP